MAYETKFAIRPATIQAGAFTDIVGTSMLPIDCNTVLVMNDTGQDINLRTDPANANSQVVVHDGQSFTIGGQDSGGGHGARFLAGSQNPVCSLEASVSQVSPLIISIL